MSSTLVAWLEEVRDLITHRIDELVQFVGLPRWHANPFGGFKHYPYDAFFRFSVLDEALFANRGSWNEVEKFAADHENLRRHAGQFVSSASGSGRSFSLQELCKWMIPRPKVVGENSIYIDTDFDSNAIVRDFLADLSSDFIENTTVWPIHGLWTDVKVTLDDKTEFRELTVDEKLHCLNFEIIRDGHQNEISAEQSRWFGLCRKIEDRKLFGHNNEPLVTEFIDRYTQQEQVLEDFLVSVPLTNDRVAFHAGGVSSAPHFETGKVLASGTIGRSVGASNAIRFMFVDEGAKLSAEEVEKLRNIWTFIRGTKNGAFKKRVSIAARRLFYAETRTKHDDALVDLMVAAEALYLDTEKNELNYRMSLNAALWADVENQEKTNIFNAFKTAYALRSKVVHGAAASPESVTESISTIRPLLRDGIRKALVHLNTTQAAPDWTGMVFAPKAGTSIPSSK